MGWACNTSGRISKPCITYSDCMTDVVKRKHCYGLLIEPE